MPITLSDAIRRTRALVDEPAYPTLPNSTSTSNPAKFYTDTEITDWVNDGLRDIARRSEDLHTYDTTLSIPAYGQNPAQPIPTYPLTLGPQVVTPAGQPQTSDVLRITRVEWQMANNSNQTYPLEWQTQQYLDQIWNINQLSNQSYPTYWTTRGFPGGVGRSQFVIQLYPQPAQAGQLNVFYYRLPARIADPVANPASYNAPLDILEGWDDMLIDYVHAKALLKARNPLYKEVQALYESKMANIIDQTRFFSDQARFFVYDNVGMPWSFDNWGSW